MRHGVTASCAASLAALLLVLQDPQRPLADRVTDLEKRVAELESKLGARVPLPPAMKWTPQQMRALFIATGELQRSQASPVELGKRFGDLSDAFGECMRAIERASDLASGAEREHAFGNVQQASRMAQEALDLYNEVAKKVGSDPRTIDGPAPPGPERRTKG